jgi:hypothetical protein
MYGSGGDELQGGWRIGRSRICKDMTARCAVTDMQERWQKDRGLSMGYSGWFPTHAITAIRAWSLRSAQPGSRPLILILQPG